MKFLILAFVICATATVFADEADDHAWNSFKLEHSKLFLSKNKEVARKKTFLKNRAKVADLQAQADAGELKFNVKLYAHADLTEDEFVSRFGGLELSDEDLAVKRTTYVPTTRQNIPASYDSRTQNILSPIRNQGNCNSCWAFASLCCVETGLAKKGTRNVDLSEQQMVDCAKKDCNPSSVSLAFDYMATNGACTETEYPYTGVYNGRCSKAGGTYKYTNKINPGTTANSVKAALVENGALMIAIDCGPWNVYKNGIFHLDQGKGINHAVNLVGWGTENGDDYWIVRNSWGTGFGENGYIRLSTQANGGYNLQYTWGVKV